MKKIHTILFAVFVAGGIQAHGASEPVTAEAVRSALADPAAAMLACPTPGQIEWADMELGMFLCLDPCTWQAREYDDHSAPLKDLILPKLDVNQWCEAANAFGAKQVVMVLFNGSELPPEDCKIMGAGIIIRQTQQVTDQTRTELKLKVDPAAAAREAEIRMISQQ